ncbi:MAG TPA: glycoside hydrolase family 9 protein [Clostridia bacterium]|nr:glycoside hydrolase family 9 protein [Clostridia bacterium]
MEAEGIMEAAGTVRLNQVGYRPEDEKTAFVVSEARTFTVYNLLDEPVYIGQVQPAGTDAAGHPCMDKKSGEILGRADFSSVTEEGSYYLTAGTEKSPVFTIAENVYRELTSAVLKVFYYQRCGGDGVKSEFTDPVFAHKPCHRDLARYYDATDPVHGDMITDVSGGWHDAGDYGRYVTPAAKAAVDLMLAFEYFPSIAGIDFGGPCKLPDEVRYELEWMLRMQDRRTGGVFHKVTTQIHANIACLPEDDHAQLYLSPISAQATGGFAAALAHAARVYQKYGDGFADICLAAAVNAWKWLESNPDTNEYTNPGFFRTGSYNDTDAEDERWWAAAELYGTTGDAEYLRYLTAAPLPGPGFGWADMGSYALLAYITSENTDHGSELYLKARDKFIESADWIVSITRKEGYGVGLEHYAWGSNMYAANNAMTLIIADRLKPEKKYTKATLDHFHYLLGGNVNSRSYVTGFGQNAVRNPHHRPSMIKGQAVPGMLVGGPFERVWALKGDPASRFFNENTPPEKCYADIWESFSTNEICIYWNSPLVFILGYLGERE